MSVLPCDHQVLHGILLCAPPHECRQSAKEEHLAIGFQHPEDFAVERLKLIRPSRRDEMQANFQ
jgi:hypothetical protein